jgi:hypothetical protein
MKFSLRWGVILPVILPVSLLASFQIASSQSSVPFVDTRGRTTYAEIDSITRSVKRIHGLSANIRDYGKTQNDLNPQVVKEIARSLVQEYGSILKIKWSEIRPKHIDTDGQWWFAEMQQLHGGVPVEGSDISFSIDPQGNVVTLGTRIFPGIAVSVQPAISMEAGERIGIEEFGVPSAGILEPAALCVLPIRSDSQVLYHLAWKTTIASGLRNKTYYISATDGSVLKARTNTLSSTVSGNLSLSYYPTGANEHPTVIGYPLRNIQAYTYPGAQLLGSTSANTQGTYAINLGNIATQQITVRYTFENADVQVRNDCSGLPSTPGCTGGGDIVVDNLVTLPGDAAANHTCSGEAANVLYHVPIVHAWFNSHLNFHTLDIQMHAFVGMGAGENGVSDGVNIGFGSQGGLAWADSGEVIFHEYAHDVIYQLYHSFIRDLGDPQGAAMDEGLADYFACTITDDPNYSEDVDPHPRTLDNTLVWNSQLEAHIGGEVIGGAVWNTRKRVGSSVADNLTYKALQLTPHARNFQDFLYNLLKIDQSVYGGMYHGQIEASFAEHSIYPPGPAGIPVASTVAGGWNLISVPVQSYDYASQAAQYSPSFIFPTANSPIYGYPVDNGGYVAQSPLTNGAGYWASFPSSQSLFQFGPGLTSVQTSVHAGWNMIGSLSQSIGASTVSSSPPSIVTSNFFGYRTADLTSYYAASSIEPGKGYWVKVNQPGQLILSTGGAGGATGGGCNPPPPSPAGEPAAPTLATPANGTSGIATSATLTWNASPGALAYRLQVSAVPDFSSLSYDASGLTSRSAAVNGLSYSTTYFWRVSASNSNGMSAWSCPWAFSTQDPPSCSCCVNSTASLDQLMITDATGRGQELFVLNAERSGDLPFRELEMPPALPGKIFDARFLSGRFLEKLAVGAGFTPIPVVLQNVHLPVTIAWDLKSVNNAQYQLAIPGKESRTIQLGGKGSISLGGVTNGRLALTAQAGAPAPCGTSSSTKADRPGEAAVPETYRLEQNYPNPFNPTTVIGYDLPEQAQVILVVYNPLGQVVRTVVNEMQSPGYKSAIFDARDLPSGVYFYRLQAGSFRGVRKMILTK